MGTREARLWKMEVLCKGANRSWVKLQKKSEEEGVEKKNMMIWWERQTDDEEGEWGVEREEQTWDDEDDEKASVELKGEDHVPNRSEHSASGTLPRLKNNLKLPQNKYHKVK